MGIYDKESDTISFPYSQDEKGQSKTISAKNTISAYVIKNNKALFLSGDEVDAFIKEHDITRVGAPAKCWLGVPLSDNEEVIGLIAVQSYDNVNAYSEKDLKLIYFVADQVAASIREKQNEVKLKKLHLENQQLISSIASIMIVMDENERVILWNKTTAKTFGINEDEALNKKILETGLSWDWEKVAPAIGECRLKKEKISVHDVEYQLSNGRKGFVNLIVSPFEGGNSKFPGFLIFGEDVTESKIMESKLSQAQKLESIGQLAAGIAHEINTPTQFVGDNTNFLKDAFSDFNDLIGQFETLKEDVKNKKDTKAIISNIDTLIEDIDLSYLLEEIPIAINQSLEGVSRVSKIVQAMKEFSHPGTKDKISIDLNKAIQNTITVSQNEWKYIADLQSDFDESLPLVPCLPDAFNQVILNLIINAVHAIEDSLKTNKEQKGSITISTKHLAKEIEIRIKDNGSGIPEAVQPKIFDPFFTTKEVGKGTGQGLAISHDVITKKHNGTIGFETENEKGTTFIIRLPLN